MRTYHILISLLPKQERRQQQPSASDATFIPSTFFQPLPNHKPRPTNRRNALINSRQTDYRLGPIRIDWADLTVKMNAGKNKERRRGPVTATFKPNTQNVASGCTNLPEGTVHVFRDSADQDEKLSIDIGLSRTTLTEDDIGGVSLAVLAVPSYMSPADFLAFAAPAGEGMAHVRIIHDSLPNRSMAILKFRQASDASDFVEVYNGRPFNAMEAEICHIVRVSSITIDSEDPASVAFTKLVSAHGPMQELPTCPVCLERMDAAVTGLITVPCSHTFHCMCLSKWGDSRCPVCRYSQILLSSHRNLPSTQPTSTTPTLSTCFSCPSTTNLWICLICGNIGCGRYGRAHAQAHYELTTHLYALELESQRVWDYAGDGYVHRLIQNRADGKLVELPSAASSTGTSRSESGQGPSASDALGAEKIEAIGIEYSYLLTSQLDSQRAYYEEKNAELIGQVSELKTMVEDLNKDLVLQRSATEEERIKRIRTEETREEEIARAKSKAESRADKATELARKFGKELREEKAVSEGLLTNLKEMKERVDGFEKQRGEFNDRIKDLEDQLRDVMFFLDANAKIERGEGVESEAAGGSIEISTSNPPMKKKKGKKR